MEDQTPLLIGNTILYGDSRIEWMKEEEGDEIKTGQWSDWLLKGVDGEGNIFYCTAGGPPEWANGPDFNENTEVEIDDIEECDHPEKMREWYDDNINGACHKCNGSITMDMFQPDWDEMAKDRIIQGMIDKKRGK